MDNTNNVEKYTKYLKIGSWIVTVIIVVLMLANVIKSDDFDEIIDSAKSQDSIEKYIDKKYSNMINK